jgi:uncharacterized phage protein gp47/JayE
MATNNPWLTPYQRSYNDIKTKLISELRNRVPEITDFSEGNIFILIISIFAAIAEVIHYYIDNMARETFFPTARRYSSLYKHSKLVDYHIKSAIPASVDLTLYKSNNKPTSTDITIPVNTVFNSIDGKQWLVSKTVLWEKGTYSIKVSVVQKEKVGDPNRIQLGNITSNNPIIYLGDLPADKKYMEGSMVLYIDNEPWILVDTFAYSSSIDKTYKVELDQNLKPYIIFGDGSFGMKPNLNGKVEGVYYLTYGSLGNIEENSFNTVPSSILDIESDIKVINTNPASGGSDYEDFDMLKDHVPLSIKTLGVAITKEDFEAITKMAPGVDKAYVNYICGKYVDIYITPDGGGEASLALRESTLDYVSKSKIITTNLSVSSTHRALIYIDADIYGRRSFTKTDISDQVKKALIEAYSHNTSDINKVVRLSDIYALIDNQSMVDYLNLNKLYLLGYPTPIDNPNTSPELNISSFVQNYFNGVGGSISETMVITILENGYKITDTSQKTYNGQFGQNLTVNNDNVGFTITIGDSTSGLRYNVGDRYNLFIQKMNMDLVPMNYNIPIFKSETINLTIHEVV